MKKHLSILLILGSLNSIKAELIPVPTTPTVLGVGAFVISPNAMSIQGRSADACVSGLGASSVEIASNVINVGWSYEWVPTVPGEPSPTFSTTVTTSYTIRAQATTFVHASTFNMYSFATVACAATGTAGKSSTVRTSINNNSVPNYDSKLESDTWELTSIWSGRFTSTISGGAAAGAEFALGPWFAVMCDFAADSTISTIQN